MKDDFANSLIEVNCDIHASVKTSLTKAISKSLKQVFVITWNTSDILQVKNYNIYGKVIVIVYDINFAIQNAIKNLNAFDPVTVNPNSLIMTGYF